jgi:hypothetical protein
MGSCRSGVRRIEGAVWHQYGGPSFGSPADESHIQETQMLYKGSCHCGRIAFQVDGTLEGVEPGSLPVTNFDGRSL